jgi:hypothetical protein
MLEVLGISLDLEYPQAHTGTTPVSIYICMDRSVCTRAFDCILRGMFGYGPIPLLVMASDSWSVATVSVNSCRPSHNADHCATSFAILA